MVCPTTAETINEQDYLEQLVASNASGAVVINGRYANIGFGYETYTRLIRHGMRIVLVNAVDRPVPVPSVTVDIAAGAALGVHHLATLGHAAIGCLVGPRRYTTARDFAAGWRSAVIEHGLSPDERLLSETLFSIGGGQAGTPRLLEAGATGIVAASDLMAIGAVRAVRLWGMRVPYDVSVVGFDGTLLASVTDPPLTTVRQPVDQLSAAVAALYVGPPPIEEPLAPQTYVPDLVVGASTGVRRSRNPE